MSSTNSKFSGLKTIFCPQVKPGSHRYTLHEGRAYFTPKVPHSILTLYGRHHTPARHAYASETVFVFAHGPKDPMVPELKKRGLLVYDCAFVEHSVNRRLVLPMAEFLIHDGPTPEDLARESLRNIEQRVVRSTTGPFMSSMDIGYPTSSMRFTQTLSRSARIAIAWAEQEPFTPTKTPKSTTAHRRAIGPYPSYHSTTSSSASTTSFSSPASSNATLYSEASSSSRYDKFNCAPLCTIEPAKWCARRTPSEEFAGGNVEGRVTFDYQDVMGQLDGLRGKRQARA
ncbi:hypothetical protein IAT38_005221 [Cryptococcus sp. DSM 104549]